MGFLWCLVSVCSPSLWGLNGIFRICWTRVLGTLLLSAPCFWENNMGNQGGVAFCICLFAMLLPLLLSLHTNSELGLNGRFPYLIHSPARLGALNSLCQLLFPVPGCRTSFNSLCRAACVFRVFNDFQWEASLKHWVGLTGHWSRFCAVRIRKVRVSRCWDAEMFSSKRFCLVRLAMALAVQKPVNTGKCFQCGNKFSAYSSNDSPILAASSQDLRY